MSTLNHSRSVVDKMLSTMENRGKPTVNIVKVERCENEGFARVTASVVHTAASRANPSSVLQALGAKFNNKIRPIQHSFHSLASSSVGETITGIISANPETHVYDAKDTKFKAVAGNMFMDEEDQLWSLRKTEAGGVLIKSRSKDDADIISELMTGLSSSGVGSLAFEATASSAQDEGVRSSLEGGDFITFVNPQSEQVEFGAVLASVFDDRGTDLRQLVVQPVEASAAPVKIDRAMALGVFDDVDDLGDDVQTAEASAHTLEYIASYYQRMFQRDPSYFEKFMERWVNHVFS